MRLGAAAQAPQGIGAPGQGVYQGGLVAGLLTGLLTVPKCGVLTGQVACLGRMAAKRLQVFHGNTSALTNNSTILGTSAVRTALNSALLNADTIAPGFSVGSLALDGDLAQTTTGKGQIALTGLTSFDRAGRPHVAAQLNVQANSVQAYATAMMHKIGLSSQVELAGALRRRQRASTA